MHMTLAELANSDPEMRVKDKPGFGGRLFDAPIPVWFTSGWDGGVSYISVYFSDGSIKRMTHKEAADLVSPLIDT